MKWFVMLRSRTREIPLPLVTLEDDIALFDSKEEAEEAANKNILGEAYGFKTYQW